MPSNWTSTTAPMIWLIFPTFFDSVFGWVSAAPGLAALLNIICAPFTILLIIFNNFNFILKLKIKTRATSAAPFCIFVLEYKFLSDFVFDEIDFCSKEGQKGLVVQDDFEVFLGYLRVGSVRRIFLFLERNLNHRKVRCILFESSKFWSSNLGPVSIGWDLSFFWEHFESFKFTKVTICLFIFILIIFIIYGNWRKNLNGNWIN